jgi:hypothetical protein
VRGSQVTGGTTVRRLGEKAVHPGARGPHRLPLRRRERRPPRAEHPGAGELVAEPADVLRRLFQHGALRGCEVEEPREHLPAGPARVREARRRGDPCMPAGGEEGRVQVEQRGPARLRLGGRRGAGMDAAGEEAGTRNGKERARIVPQQRDGPLHPPLEGGAPEAVLGGARVLAEQPGERGPEAGERRIGAPGGPGEAVRECRRSVEVRPRVLLAPQECLPCAGFRGGREERGYRGAGRKPGRPGGARLRRGIGVPCALEPPGRVPVLPALTRRRGA